MNQNRGAILFRGRASWTLNEDAARVIDMPVAAWDLHTPEALVLSVRNGSADIDLTATYGNLVKCYPASWLPLKRESLACAMLEATDTVSATAHGLVVGDAVTFATTGGGVTVGTIYYVIAVPDANSFQFATARGGSAFNITADEANTILIATEFFVVGSVTVEKFAAETSTAEVKGVEDTVVTGFPAGGEGARVRLTKSASTAAAFSAYVEVRRA